MNKTLNTKNSGNKKGIVSKEVTAIVQELKVETPTLLERLEQVEDLLAKAKSDVSFATTELESANATEWDKDRQSKATTQLELVQAEYQRIVAISEELGNELQEEIDKSNPEEVKEIIATEEVKAVIETEKVKETLEVEEDAKVVEEDAKVVEEDAKVVKEVEANSDLEGQKSSVDGMTVEDMRKANEQMDADAKARAAIAQEKSLETPLTQEQIDAKAIADQKAIDDAKALDKKIETIVENKSNKKTLVPKAWQRVSEDGNQLINVITFMGEKMDYAVGMKNKYRFGNLSVSDGVTRIVTAKFPKEDTVANKESIVYKGYQVDIDKYGNSAVCLLKDPDGIVMVEFVSLATVIDVLQDELNPGKECEITWGTIDQVIKFKRGLKSRIKNLTEEDAPKRTRVTSEIATEESKTEVKEEAKTEEIIVKKEEATV